MRRTTWLLIPVALAAACASPVGGDGGTGFPSTGGGSTGGADAGRPIPDAGGPLGAACGAGGCATGLGCLLQIPGGYCSAPCGAGVGCPAGGSCVEVLPGQGACGRACATAADCLRPGDACDPGCQVCVPSFAVGQVGCGAIAQGAGGRLPDGGACGALPAGDGGSSAPALAFGASQLVSAGPSSAAESQPALAVGGGALVVAYMDDVDGGPAAFEGNALGISLSTDDGATFSVLPPLVSTADTLAFDPSLGYAGAADGGQFFLAFAAYDAQSGASPPTGHAYASSSTDGRSWSAPVPIEGGSASGAAGGLVDKPALAVNPVTGAPWVTFLAAKGEFGGPGPYAIELAVGDPVGSAFAAPVQVDDGLRPGSFKDLPALAFDGRGNGYVAWVEANDGASVALDQNTGTSIGGSAANAIYFSSVATLDGGSLAIGAPNRVVSAPGDVVAVVDPGVAVARDGSSLYVSFVVGDANATDVVVSASHDLGQSFLPPVKVNDDSTCATHYQAAPLVDAQNRLWVAWTDDRAGTGDVFYAVSSDGGKTFSVNRLVSDAPSYFTTLRNVPAWLGDEVLLALDGPTVYAAWAGAVGGTSPSSPAHVRLAKAPLPP
ncbi:MAG: sialidase family protein [Deltaproteobacteria bacterium]